MQADPVDSTKMPISTDDHRWDEQDQYESDEYKDRLLRLIKKLELQGKEKRPGDYFHQVLEHICKKKLWWLHEQEFLDSLQRKWETGEGLDRLVMKAPEDLGKEQGFENLPPEEIERQFKVEIELSIKDRFERHMCKRWADYFQQSLGMQGLQAMPDDLPEFRRQIVRLRRQTLQHWQHELLCMERAYLRSQKEVDEFPGGDDTNRASSSTHVPNSVSVRVQAQGSHTNMDENVPATTAGSVGCAGDKSSALLAVPTSVHQQFILNNPGGEGSSDVPRSNHHGPGVTFSSEANRVTMVDLLTANQSRDKSFSPLPARKFYFPPEDESQLEARLKHIQMMSSDSENFDSTCDYLNKSVGPKSILDMGPVSSSQGTGSTLSGGNNCHRETVSDYNHMPDAIFDTQSQLHCTGCFHVLSDLRMLSRNIVIRTANNEEMETFMSGSVSLENFRLHDVHYCPDLGNRIIVSGSILDNDGYGYEFGQGKFTVKDLNNNNTTVGEGRLVDQNYILDYLKIPRDRTRAPEQPGLVTTLRNAICSALHRLGLKY